MLTLQIPAVSMIAMLIVTFLFSMRDNSAKEVRLRFLISLPIAMFFL